MQPEDISQIQQYLSIHPELGNRLSLSPPAVKCGTIVATD